jgi:hypothetical protein
MRERAFAKRQQARDEALAREPGQTLVERLRELLRRGDGA